MGATSSSDRVIDDHKSNLDALHDSGLLELDLGSVLLDLEALDAQEANVKKIKARTGFQTMI